MEDARSFTLSGLSGAGAEYTCSGGHSAPEHHGDPFAEYAALRSSAALVDLSFFILRFTGKRAAEMLNAVLSNSVPGEERRGTYALLLDPKGRIQTDLRIIKSSEDVLALVEPAGARAAKGILGRYAPFSRVKLEELEGWSALGLYGPESQEMLGVELEEHETVEIEVGGVSLLGAGVSRPVSGYDLLGPAEALRAAREHLASKGARPAGLLASETVRVEAGIPRFGADLTPENFPAEAGLLERAVSLQKGCYPGQETVARMHYRGHPNRNLHRLTIEGPVPQPGTRILQNDKPVGKITSVAPLPANGETLALGYLHRKADADAPLQADKARVSPLEKT
jgi:aminomethyltransferase